MCVLLVLFSEEYPPSLQSRLLIHSVLDLPVDIIGIVLLEVKLKASALMVLPHNEVASIEFPTLDRHRLLRYLDLPVLHLLLAFFVILEHLYEVATLLDTLGGIGIGDDCEIFHEVEVCPHRFREASLLAELWHQDYFVSRLLMHVHNDWLVGIPYLLAIFCLKVVKVSNGTPSLALLEGIRERHVKLNIINLVHPLIVGSHHYGANKGSLNIFSGVISGLLPNIVDQLENTLSPDYFMADVHVEHDTPL